MRHATARRCLLSAGLGSTLHWLVVVPLRASAYALCTAVTWVSEGARVATPTRERNRADREGRGHGLGEPARGQGVLGWGDGLSGPRDPI